jgi:hypothetical protein
MSYSPSLFQSKNNELTNRYNIIIAEIVKTYPNYKSNPNFNTFDSSYKTNISNLKQLQQEIFLLKNDLNKGIDTMQQDIKNIDETIFTLDEENKVLKAQLNDLNNSDNAAHGMLKDSKTLYKQQLVGNILLFLALGGINLLEKG